ncbi:MAG: helix-turn-helix domain-containing protein [Nitrososphaerales archaeon]
MDSEKSLAENFKLSLYEARVYIALTSGSMSPKQVSVSARVPLSRTYDTLRSLQQKGFVEERGEVFSAISAKAALGMRLRQFEDEFAKAQRARMDATESLLKSLGAGVRPPLQRDQEVALLRGINAIASKFSEIIAASDDVILVAKSSIDAARFFKPYLQKKMPRSVRILIPSGFTIRRSDARFLKTLSIQVRRTNSILLDLMVADESTVIIGVPDPTSKEAYHSIAIAVSSQPFATAVRASLEEVWSSAR